ncbi:uncharacterized protein LOC123666115 [Melitaea cinxia]|uniref:uncharacterized protein LOC123666115 n=1 Tax=Melitaea cinxia TaxID=113334 RepID=UPI001E26F0C0|nr:uncharacterized protein LOC123666115 [Melitaea cinxia]
MRYPTIFFLPFWVINCSETPQNNTEIFIKYSHSDVEPTIDRRNIDDEKKIINNGNSEKIVRKVTEEKIETEKVPIVPEASGDVVFVPNDKPIFRNEDVFNVNDAVNTRRVGDLLSEDKHHIATEKANQDILFISGKNDENVEKTVQMKKTKNEPKSKAVPSRKKSKNLDCTRLDCNNTVESICGGRKENNQWKYRLFLNDCYLRKVNCGFQYPENRYDVVNMEKCKRIGGHYKTRSYNFKPIPVIDKKTFTNNETRRSFSSRRSLNMGIDGTICGHKCPISCTEDHDPQCAISNTGHRKVFLNHCQLDQNSCINNIVWHRRPLSECVGGRKADMNQNRGFIAWMQRAGMIDRNGRLVLN